jgi:hypothetical protein
MGISSDAILAYGYQLDSPEEGWMIEEVNEYGALKLDWLDNDSGDIDEDFIDQADERFEAAGVTGVRLMNFCHIDAPMWILSATHIRAWRGDVKVLDLADLAAEPEVQGYDARLTAACRALGITPRQKAPAWLLVSYLG